MSEDKELKPNINEVKLEHRHNYVGGAFAYKNSSQSGKLLDPENFQETVMMIGRGKARPVRISAPKEETRAGVYPQHNSPQDFSEEIEFIESKSLEAYERLNDIHLLTELGYKHMLVTLPKDRLAKLHAQYAHLSKFAFHQMLGIPNPDKTEFDVWVKKIEKNKQLIVAYPYKKTGITIFVQVIDYDDDFKNVIGIKHCTFDEGNAIVVNETILDSYSNLRQLAHLGIKGAGKAFNSVERFDDGTVAWTITVKKDKEKITGVAALKPDDTILIVRDELNEASMLAAKNLGAEEVIDDKWTGNFSKAACKVDCHPMQRTFKDTVRTQIGQIVDGATIPGLTPIFVVHPESV